jgi:uncharacterized protein
VPTGTQIVLRTDVFVHASQTEYPRGSVAEIVRPPDDGGHSYRAKVTDGAEFSMRRHEFSILKQVKAGPMGDPAHVLAEYDLYENVIYKCVVGSQAYGLERDSSDIDRRGIYLAPAELEWSLYGVPEQLESRESEECYWELKKFMVLALKPIQTFWSASTRRLLKSGHRLPTSCWQDVRFSSRNWSIRPTTAT